MAATDALLHSGMVKLGQVEEYIRVRAGWPCIAQARQVLELAEPASDQ